MRIKPLEETTCAECRGPASIVQINGKSVLVEPLAAISGSTITLQLHRCPSAPPAAARPEGGARRG